MGVFEIIENLLNIFIDIDGKYVFNNNYYK